MKSDVIYPRRRHTGGLHGLGRARDPGEWLEPGMHVISIGGRPDEAARRRFDVTLRLGTASAPVGRPELAVSDEHVGIPADHFMSGPGGNRTVTVREMDWGVSSA